MTGQNYALLVREYTPTNSTTLPDTTIVLLSNVVKDDFAKEIAKADEDIGGVPATRNLIASTTSREYSLPEDFLIIKRVEAKFDGTNSIKLEEFDLTQNKRENDEAVITAYYTNERGHSFYDIFRNALWIYSGTITAVTAGLKLWYVQYPADISTGSLALATDLSLDPTTTSWQIGRQFHELWARKVSIMWKSNREKPLPLTESERNFDTDFKSAISSITNLNKDREIVGGLPTDVHLQY